MVLFLSLVSSVCFDVWFHGLMIGVRIRGRVRVRARVRVRVNPWPHDRSSQMLPHIELRLTKNTLLTELLGRCQWHGVGESFFGRVTMRERVAEG